MDGRNDLPWDIFVELRKEVVELQKLRAQTLGFKITVVGAGIGLVVARQDIVGWELLAVPAFAAVLFDLLSNAYSGSIQRIGRYLRDIIEPQLKASAGWANPDLPLWEEYVETVAFRRWHALYGQVGLTTMAVAAAIWGLTVSDAGVWFRWPSGVVLMALTAFSLLTSR